MKVFIRIFYLCFFFIVLNISVFAQTGGNNNFEFLNLPNSARIAALGGNMLAIRDNDVNLAANNPSLITPSLHKNLSLSFTDFYVGAKYGMASYSHTFNKAGSFAGSVQFINYDDFVYADDQGDQSGTYTGGEYAYNIGWGRILDTVFSIGANVRFITSQLESYRSNALSVDVAGSYIPSQQTAVSLVIRNIGRQLKSYTTYESQNLPFEIQAAVSHKLQHIPFRYCINLQHLERWDLRYNSDNNSGQIEGSSQSNMDIFADNLMRHIVFGVEFIPAKFFSLRAGYNYNRRQDLKVTDRLGTIGFSWGFGIKVSRFSFDYARSAYHLSGSPNFFSIGIDLGKK